MNNDQRAALKLVGSCWPSTLDEQWPSYWCSEQRDIFVDEIRDMDLAQAEAAIREEYRTNSGTQKLMSRLCGRLREIRRQNKQARVGGTATGRKGQIIEDQDDASPKRTVREFIAAVESGEVQLDEREWNGFRWMKRAIAEEKRNRGSVSTKGVSR